MLFDKNPFEKPGPPQKKQKSSLLKKSTGSKTRKISLNANPPPSNQKLFASHPLVHNRNYSFPSSLLHLTLPSSPFSSSSFSPFLSLSSSSSSSSSSSFLSPSSSSSPSCSSPFLPHSSPLEIQNKVATSDVHVPLPSRIVILGKRKVMDGPSVSVPPPHVLPLSPKTPLNSTVALNFNNNQMDYRTGTCKSE